MNDHEIKIFPSRKFYHIGKIDLGNDGTLIECAIVKKDSLGNIYFIRLDQLDNVDLRRIHKIVTSRSADKYELYELMHHNVLGNGINALHYFDQLVRVITPSGQIVKPSRGNIGVSRKVLERQGQSPVPEARAPEVPEPQKPARRTTTKTAKAAKS